VVYFKVSDDRFDNFLSVEQSALLIGQPLARAPVFALDVRPILVHDPLTQVGINDIGPHAQAFRQDGALSSLFVHCVPAIWIAGKLPAPPSSTPNPVFPGFWPLDPNKIKHLALPFWFCCSGNFLCFKCWQCLLLIENIF